MVEFINVADTSDSSANESDQKNMSTPTHTNFSAVTGVPSPAGGAQPRYIQESIHNGVSNKVGAILVLSKSRYMKHFIVAALKLMDHALK